MVMSMMKVLISIYYCFIKLILDLDVVTDEKLVKINKIIHRHKRSHVTTSLHDTSPHTSSSGVGCDVAPGCNGDYTVHCVDNNNTQRLTKVLSQFCAQIYFQLLELFYFF